MPSKERYAREKAEAAARGLTPYQVRMAHARAEYGEKVATNVARGHARPGQATLAARRRSRRALEDRTPDGWCRVCESQIEETRPASLTDRECGSEQMRRWRAGELPDSGFEAMAALAADEIWVARRRAQSRRRLIPLRPRRTPTA